MPDATFYPGFHDTYDASRSQEDARKVDFKACPILADFLATMLQDLQYTEADNACEDEREEGDTGTIYTVSQAVYDRCKAFCEAFMRDNAEAIEEALDLVPGEDGLRYGRNGISYERIGSTLYMEVVGHGVSFTDDGDADCLQKLREAGNAVRMEFDFDHESETVYMYGG